ncbi:unnamed protein product [Caenorhabditis sp. 36 PRJEB53466]|nr:unnamed protein product [Caenorhabditis sp. 36 PRJEB53466]
MHSKFNEFREAAIHLASERFPESVDCIDKCSDDIDKFHEYVKSRVPTIKSSLEDILGDEQIHQLYQLLEKTQRADLVEKGLHQHLHGMSEKRRHELLSEFFASKPARAKRSTINRAIAREPAPLPAEMVSWQTPRHKNVILRQRKSNGSQWDIMNTIGEQYYHLRKSVRVKFDKNYTDYCRDNILPIIGNDSFALLEDMYQDSEQIEHISNKYQQIIGYLKSEEDQLTAEHYGQFCRKIYRLVPIEQADLMSWLSPVQKLKIAEMIQDANVNDSQVYEKLYEFFNQATGAAKDDADEVITLGCRKFIAHHLGDQVAEDIEDLRVAGGTGSSHHSAALLSVKHYELEAAGELAHRKRIEESLSICKRIYLDYDGSCYCNGRAKSCNRMNHACENCTGGTLGFQCEKCPEGRRLDRMGRCSDGLTHECFCNKHSVDCLDGVCLNCENHSTGEHCELCDVGFYGDPTKGEKGCVKCPCPKNGECSYNTVTNTIECNDCPKGHIGERCEDSESSYQPFTTEASTVTLLDNQL